MPGFITHYVFGRDVIRSLSKQKLKEIIKLHKQVFYLGTQGPDIFSYNFHLLMFHDQRNIGSYMHHYRTKRFFETAFWQLDKIEKEEYLCFLAYISGFFCHYILDSICHPYVYARTDFDVNHSSNAYYEKHFELENQIDRYYAKQSLNIPYEKIPQQDVFCLPKQEENSIAYHLSQCLKKTYQDLWKKKEPSPDFIKRTLYLARIESKLLSDPNSRKKMIIEKIENKTIHHHLLSSKFITAKSYNQGDYLNLQKEEWKNPWDLQRNSNESFLDLFKKSLNCAQELLPLILEERKQLISKLDDTSYYSGTI